MKKLSVWLGIAAIVLQTAWPLLAGVLPRAVALVPLCTVDGVTHYLEVPTGKTPLDQPAGHGDHCPLCCLGAPPALAAQPASFSFPEGRAVLPVGSQTAAPDRPFASSRWARAPPLFPVVTSNDHESGSSDEEALLAGGDAGRAPYRGRLVRLGVLHDQH